ncbi:hypothetical protein AU490_05700 [Lonsdalea populi]|uniref:cyclic-guanylate-specific phosphodiesterase n=1 Tax=Lonsdalea populi TaxID=1172565 RepID=A0A3N0UEZ1_9GAMM|nr:hypothetical protein AU486_00890 [Lonsdalea quercina]RAT29650.1 hypothetical protein AU490_05700 [Lonsdalea populi]RAT39138.1 hypothetical protein AU491_02370 [Lonsdalea populi]RAT43390.1 hypothetical protein AU496_12440 [Lonsdalea populi]RAT51130.1 hypothetical protein AU498_11370 [Lonsdalea populi]
MGGELEFIKAGEVNVKSINKMILAMVVAGIVGGILILLLLSQRVIAKNDQKKLQDYAAAIMNRSDDVVTESNTVLNEAYALKYSPCSEDDLFQLRYMVYKYRYIMDVGRIQNGELLCTAGRGVLPSPIALPETDVQKADGTQLWTAVKGLIDPRIQTDIASRKNVVVFMSPDAFRSFSYPLRGYGAILTSADDQHVFQTFGSKSVTPSRYESSWLAQYRQSYLCSKLYEICIHARLSASGVLQMPTYMISAISLLGAILGGSLTLVFFLLLDINRSISKQLRLAVSHKKLHVNYQPIIYLNDEKIIGVEALARWTDKHGQSVSPDVFIPIAEKQGIIGEITRHITRLSIAEMQSLLLNNPEFYLSINLDISDVLDTDYQAYLNEQVANFNVTPKQIILEITERSTANYTTLAKRLSEFRAQGYRIAIDDFGTGYSNFSYLSSLPFDAIKIDRMFTEAIGTDSVNARMVDLLFTMTAMLNTCVIVEGIETAAQAAYVKEHCTDAVGQGWHFGRPMSATRLKALLS